MTTPYERQINWNMSMRKEAEKAALEDDRIITNAMLRAQDQERIELLEGLLKEAMGALMGDFEVNPHDVLERIRAALEGK